MRNKVISDFPTILYVPFIIYVKKQNDNTLLEFLYQILQCFEKVNNFILQIMKEKP